MNRTWFKWGFVAFFLAMLVATCSKAFAQEGLVFATGNLKSGTYSQMFTEYTRYCQPSTIGVMIKQQETTGSVQNLQLLLDNKVNAAYIQSDLLFMSRAMNPEKTKNIVTLFGLHPEEVHFVATTATRKEGGFLGVGATKFSYNTVSDLAGRNVGGVGGSVVTAKLISQVAGYNFNVLEYPNNEALKAALLEGKIDAIVVVGGAPHPLVTSLNRDFRLLPMGQDTQAKLKDIYSVTKVDYDNLGAAGINTVATQALVVTRVYTSAAMLQNLAKLRKCEKDNLDALKDALGTHAKWQAVSAGNDGKWPLADLPPVK